MAKKNVTFADIAAYTGFSKTTISRYFNNPDSITVENQEKIANALEVLDYKENKLARVMANGKTEMVGVIIPNLYMHYYSDMLDHIISTYEEYGYKFIVFAGNEDADVERRYIQELLAYKTEGLIILSHTLSSKELAEYHVPIVTIEREDEYVCSVNTDNYMGGVQAATVLAKSGCDILLHANADFPNTIPAYKRIQGFHDFSATHGLQRLQSFYKRSKKHMQRKKWESLCPMTPTPTFCSILLYENTAHCRNGIKSLVSTTLPFPERRFFPLPQLANKWTKSHRRQ